MSGLLQQAGAPPNRNAKFVPLFMDRAFTGLYTQRSPLRDPSDWATSKFYGGRPDALLDGSNVELTNRLTLQRRPGLTQLSTATYASPPNRCFSFELTDGSIRLIVDTGTGVYYDHQNGTTELLFTKAPGAGQTHFVAVAGVLYMGDGVEVKKYTPNNPNGEIWNWGIAAPTAAPTTHVVNAGSAAVAWQASTFFSTMGLLVDSNNNIQVLVSVNADASNPHSTFGTSSSGGPAWNHTIGGITVETSGVQWRNIGTLDPWQATHDYSDWIIAVTTNQSLSSTIFDVASNSIYESTMLPNSGFSGTTKPNFQGVAGVKYQDNPLPIQWVSVGAGANIAWQHSTAYALHQVITEYPTPPLPAQTSYAHACIVSGTSSTYANPSWGVNKGDSTFDNQLQWVKIGDPTSNSANWQAATTYTAWASSGDPDFSAIVDSNGNFQVCTVGGVSGGSTPAWGSGYGQPTSETGGSTVKWVCVGSAAFSTWAGNTVFCLPFIGFAPPSTSNPYGSAAVSDGTNIEYVVESGLSQNPGPPSWSPNPGDLTSDNQVLWFNYGPPPTNSFAWSKSISYVFSFKSRTLDDPYNTVPPALWAMQNGGQLPGTGFGNPTGSRTGAVSSASPSVTLSNASGGNAVVTVTGQGSLDPQVDTIEVYRTTDGGNTYLFLLDLPAPAPIGGVAGTWSFQDFMPDTATANLPGLNPLIQAPVNGVNDPPNNAFLPMAFNYQRIWGSVGSSIFFSGGPDTLVGNPNEAFDAADTFPFLANVIRAVKTTRGLLVFLPNSIELIAGGPSTASFFSVTLAPGVGLRSYNALDVYAGEIFFFSADSQFKVISPELQLADFGFPIGDKIHTWDSSAVYVAVLQAGLDAAIFLADGSTGWYRLNPRQVPGGFSGPEPIWSPFANITNGCKMVQTVETSPGIIQLLVGDNDGGSKILVRDLNVYTDDGQTYDAFYTMGSIMLANPGQIAVLKFIEADFSGVDYHPSVSILMNEISGSFTQLVNPVFDPPSIYGRKLKPTSYSPNRYYFSSVQHVARCRHMQIKVDFGATSNGDEMFNITIFGRLVVEP